MTSTFADNTVTTRIPPQLIRSDTRGKGAAEIGWGSHGDFDRCRAFARAHGVPGHMIDGFCANLHKLATGEWPGRNAHKGMHALVLDVLVAAMPAGFKGRRWSGPLAPIGVPTGDGRVFPAGILKYQSFPMPLRWQEHGQRGHDGAITVGVIEGAEEKMVDGQPMVWGHGYFLDPEVIPEVRKAIHQVEHGVAGPSVDLDSYTAVSRPDLMTGKHVAHLAEGRTRAATLVPVPAFADLRLTLEPEAVTAAVDSVETFTVNTSGWKGAPVAPREAQFDADDAVSRIEAWAGQDRKALDKMFLWINPNGEALGREGYKLPWGDIIDGKPYLIYHAVYAAAALLSGAHGGLPNIPDADKAHLRGVITEIYSHLASELGDPNIRAPWDRRPADERVTEAALIAALGAVVEEFRDMPGGHRQPRVPGVPGARRSRHIDNPHGGEFIDVPGRGPHGQIKVNGKWVYPDKGTKGAAAVRSAKENAKEAAAKKSGKTTVAKKEPVKKAPERDSEIDRERRADQERAAHLRQVAGHKPSEPEKKPEKKAEPEKKLTSHEAAEKSVTTAKKTAEKKEAAKKAVTSQEAAEKSVKKAAAPKGRGHVAEQIKESGNDDEGRTRQHHVDRARAIAGMASELDEMDFNEGGLDEVKRRAASMVKRHEGQSGHEDLAELNDKLQRAKSVSEMSKIAHAYAESHGLKRVGRAGSVVPFDRTKHQRIGRDDHRPGEKVEIVRPGYTVNDGDKDITLHRPVVDSALPDGGSAATKPEAKAPEAETPKVSLGDRLSLRLARDAGEDGAWLKHGDSKEKRDSFTRLERAGMIERSRKGNRTHYKITDKGREALKGHEDEEPDAPPAEKLTGTPRTIVRRPKSELNDNQQSALESLEKDPNAKLHPSTRKALRSRDFIDDNGKLTSKALTHLGKGRAEKGDTGATGADELKKLDNPKLTRADKMKIRRDFFERNLDFDPETRKAWDAMSDDEKDSVIDKAIGIEVGKRSGRITPDKVEEALDDAAKEIEKENAPKGRTIVAKKEPTGHKLTATQRRALEDTRDLGPSGAKIHPATKKVLVREGLMDEHGTMTNKGRRAIGAPEREEKAPEAKAPDVAALRKERDQVAARVQKLNDRMESDRKLKGDKLEEAQKEHEDLLVKMNKLDEQIDAAQGAKRESAADREARIQKTMEEDKQRMLARPGGKEKATQESMDYLMFRAPRGHKAQTADLRELMGHRGITDRKDQDAVLRKMEEDGKLQFHGENRELVSLGTGKKEPKGRTEQTDAAGGAGKASEPRTVVAKKTASSSARGKGDGKTATQRKADLDKMRSRDQVRDYIKDMSKSELQDLLEEHRNPDHPEWSAPYRKSDSAEQLRKTLLTIHGGKEDFDAIMRGTVEPSKKPETKAPATSGKISIDSRSSKPKLANSWGGLRDPKGDVHFHPDGAIGRAIRGLGSDADLSVDGDRLDNVLGTIASDTVSGKTTAVQQLAQLKALLDRLPAGSRARRQVDAAVEDLSTPTAKAPELPDTTPKPLKTLMSELAQVPLAHDTEHKESELTLLKEIVDDWHEGKLGKFRLVSALRDLANRRHESKEGKFEIDAAIRKAIAAIESAGRDELTPPSR